MPRTTSPKSAIYEEKRDIGTCHFHQMALSGHHIDIFFKPTTPWSSPALMMESFNGFFSDMINRLLQQHAAGSDMKIQFEINCIFYKLVPVEKDGVVIFERDVRNHWFSQSSVHVKVPSDLLNDDTVNYFNRLIDNYANNGSNFVLDGIIAAAWTMVRFENLSYYKGLGARGSHDDIVDRNKNCLLGQLLKSRGVVNIDNRGRDDCFKWAVLSVLHYNDLPYHRDRMASYAEWEDDLCFDSMQFPITIPQIKIFERNNPTLAVNIFEWVGRQSAEAAKELERLGNVKSPMKILKQCTGKKASARTLVNILKFKSHYFGITNFNAVMNCGLNDRRRSWCDRCLNFFWSAEKLENHRKVCYTSKQQLEIMPKEENKNYKFDKWQKTITPLFVAYADTECLLEEDDSVERLQKHTACSVGYYIIACKDLVRRGETPPFFIFPTCVDKYKHFEGPTCVVDFLTSLQVDCLEIFEWSLIMSHTNLTMIPVDNLDEIKEGTNACQLCEKVFTDNSEKFADHNHLNGEFRYIVCATCNNKLHFKRHELHVVFHNYKNYDSHVLCIEGFGKMKDWHYSVIAQTTERYIATKASFPLRKYKVRQLGKDGKMYLAERMKNFEIVFLDSCQFLNASLQSLVDKLPREKFTELHAFFGDAEQWVYRKGVFPYSWMDSWEKLEATSFPPKEAFHDSLTDSVNISDEDYAHALYVWDRCKCAKFETYMSVYLKVDVIQLADVFENYREMVMQCDGLEVLNYFTIPQLSWDSAFKYTKTEVELLTDAEMYRFFEKGIRGGITFVNKHKVNANTPEIPETYNVEKEIKQILYVDENNLYGWGLSMRLPQKNFKWETAEDLGNMYWEIIDVEGDVGYVLEVDLEYPERTHNATLDLPLAPEKLTVQEKWFTPHMSQLYRTMYPRKSKFRGTEKLMLTQFNKKNYVVHFKILKLYLKLGLHITKIHRGVSFLQAAFFESYISMNSLLRQTTNDKMLQDYYKLKNNSLYGKTMENVRGRKAFKLVNSEEQHERLCSRDTFMSSTYFTPNLVGVNCSKHEVNLDKPIYIGQCVLDNSKWVMYDLKYNHLVRYEDKFKAKISVIGGDTDSFFLSVKGVVLNDLLQAMVTDKLLDTSNYDRSNPLYSIDRKALLGCIKDESAGELIQQSLCLRPKCYSMKMTSSGDKKRAKGVQHHVVRNILQHEDYVAAYDDNRKVFADCRRIGSRLHQLFTWQNNKLALSAFEDKRAWWSSNKSVPYGHYSLPNVELEPNLINPANPNVAPDHVDDSDTHSDTDAPPVAKRSRLIVPPEGDSDSDSDNDALRDIDPMFGDNGFIL